MIIKLVVLLVLMCMGAILLGVCFALGFKIGIRYIGATIHFSLDLIAPEEFKENNLKK